MTRAPRKCSCLSILGSVLAIAGLIATGQASNSGMPVQLSIQDQKNKTLPLDSEPDGDFDFLCNFNPDLDLEILYCSNYGHLQVPMPTALSSSDMSNSLT